MLKGETRAALILCVILSGVYAHDPTDVTDMTFNIGARSERVFYYKFAKGDIIIYNASVNKGDNISELTIEEWPGSIKYQATLVENIKDKKIIVSKTNAFIFRVKNTAIFSGKSYRLKIQRIPVSDDLLTFNTSVEWDTTYDTTYVSTIDTIILKIDTIPEEIIATEKKLGTQISGNTKVAIQVDLPERTNYWAYWLGVGQDASEGLKAMADNLPKAATALSIVNPVAAFAVGLIPQLFSLSKGDDIDYYFISDYDNTQSCMNGEAFYYLKKGERTITDYSKIETPTTGSFYLVLDNSGSVLTPKIVTVNIVAVKIIPKYEYRNVQKPILKKTPFPILHE